MKLLPPQILGIGDGGVEGERGALHSELMDLHCQHIAAHLRPPEFKSPQVILNAQ